MNINELNPYIRYANIHKTYQHGTKISSICYDCRIFFLENASGYVETDNKKYEITNNTAIYFPAHTEYLFNFDKTDNFEIYVFNFDLNQMYSHVEKSLHPANENNFEPDILPKYSFPDVLNTPIIKVIPQIKPYLLECIETFLYKNNYYKEKSSALIKLSLTEFLRGNDNTKQTDICKKIIGYIQKNYADTSLSNITIAEKFSYHPYYLGSLIKKETGETLHKHITYTRLRAAKYLLKTTAYSIEEIAWKCGFEGSAYFIKVFRENENTTPKKYRNQNIHTEF